MQLKYIKSMKKRIISIELETTSFTSLESQALECMGEPFVLFDKTYDEEFEVHINKKISTSFKIKVTFDGTTNFDGATAAANQFFEDIQEALTEVMSSLMEQFNSSEFVIATGTVPIRY